MIENPELLEKYAEKSFACGRRNHDKKKIQEVLFQVLNGEGSYESCTN